MAHAIDRSMLRKMLHSPIRNYAVPGLTSWLIGEPSLKGTMRLFECSRDHVEPITPHSHRFDFQCWVLKGSVRNRIWRGSAFDGDQFVQTSLIYGGAPGEYKKARLGVSHFTKHDTVYGQDEWYSMEAREIHSIYFAKGTEVLFFEGPTVSDQSLILEPFVDGDDIPTFEVKPWMFKRDAGAGAAA